MEIRSEYLSIGHYDVAWFFFREGWSGIRTRDLFGLSLVLSWRLFCPDALTVTSQRPRNTLWNKVDVSEVVELSEIQDFGMYQSVFDADTCDIYFNTLNYAYDVD